MMQVLEKKPEHIKDDKGERFVSVIDGKLCEVYFGVEIVPEPWRQALWGLYKNSLHIEEAIQEQSCYTEDSFIGALTDVEYNKVVLVIDGSPSGLLMGTNSLEKARVAYINPEFLRQRYPQEVREGRLWYLTCMFISPEVRNLGFAREVIRASAEAIRRKDYVLISDVCDKRLFLPDVLVGLGEDIGFPVEKEILGSQTYFALREKKPSPA
jgi:ribosomal protein S18 acetylase RimI-like enzyme